MSQNSLIFQNEIQILMHIKLVLGDNVNNEIYRNVELRREYGKTIE